MTAAYYNENDPYAAQWLRNLISEGHITYGDVDERSIKDVRPSDLDGYAQCHFFAGIGVWSHALRLAGWADDKPVWTGSCPCQPFSVAGKGNGTADERHLWPAWFHLIEQCRPGVVFGEQVEAAIRHGWLDLVQSDMEGIGYAVAPVGIPAAGVGAPHIRQRLWFVADADHQRHNREHTLLLGEEPGWHTKGMPKTARNGEASDLAHHHHQGLEGWVGMPERTAELASGAAGVDGGLEHTGGVGRNGRETTAPGHDDERAASERAQGQHGLGIASAHRLHQYGAGPTNGHWRDADWLLCRDGSWRPVEPGTFPLADRPTSRVGRLRAYGNAIVAQVAAEVIAAYMECRP